MIDISVVIPLYNALTYLPGLLQSLEDQTFPHDRLEVLLVDDVSSDQTRALAESLKAQSSLNLRLVWREQNGGVSAARNSGWRLATAPLILFIDQDCRPDPGLLTAHYQAHQFSENLAVVGRIVWSSEFRENPASEYFKQGYFPAWDTFDPNGANFDLFITSNASVRRAVLEQTGGFDERFRHNYEDIICGYKLENEAGCRLVLCQEALVYHHRALPIAEMYRRNFVAGREMARLFKHYPALIGYPSLLNPAQSLDWGYRLATIESLLSETLDQLPLDDLARLEPLTSYAARYLAEYPLPPFSDSLYRDTLTAQRHYQQQLELGRYLEARYQAAKKPKNIGSELTKRLIPIPDYNQYTNFVSGGNSGLVGSQILDYNLQNQQLAERLKAYRERPLKLAELKQNHPRIYQLYQATRRPNMPQAELHLLYDTLKEYPLSLGMAAGLKECFGITNRAELAAHPLFTELAEKWGKERTAYFAAQQHRLETGDKELSAYIGKLWNVL